MCAVCLAFSSEAIAKVGPLIKTTWHQHSPYNELCPKDKNTGEHLLVGCVATAMAQVMNYWQFPQHGIGKSSYRWNCTDYNAAQSKTLSAKYGETYYRWDQMDKDDISAAQLSYHCGVSIMMDYSNYFSGSNEYYAKSALVDYFGYSDDIQLKARNSYSDEEWTRLLKDNLDKGWPIIYSSGGHTFIVDGYNDEGYFHTNQGFGSSGDFTYTLDRLGSKTSSSALINIHPDYSSKANVMEPTFVVYNNDGTSLPYSFSNLNTVEWTQDGLTISNKAGEEKKVQNSTFSYIQPLFPNNTNK